jgi:hypothetical protein
MEMRLAQLRRTPRSWPRHASEGETAYIASIANECSSARWECNTRAVIDIDCGRDIRATLSNVGGITEMVKIMALCETSAVGIVPHFTGPVSTAALVHK